MNESAIAFPFFLVIFIAFWILLLSLHSVLLRSGR